jgi:hypothetical protein
LVDLGHLVSFDQPKNQIDQDFSDVRVIEAFVPKQLFCGLLGLLGKFRMVKAEAGDEMTAGGLSRRQSYAILPEVAAGPHEQ